MCKVCGRGYRESERACPVCDTPKQGLLTGVRCVVCGAGVGAADLERHQQQCIDERSAAVVAAPAAGACMVCGRTDVAKDALTAHQRLCAVRSAREAAAMRDADPKVEADERLAVSLSRAFHTSLLLEPCQRVALEHATKLAQPLSDAALPALGKRAAALGFSEADVTVALRFVRLKAPIIIHIHADRILKLLLADSHYRYAPPPPKALAPPALVH